MKKILIILPISLAFLFGFFRNAHAANEVYQTTFADNIAGTHEQLEFIFKPTTVIQFTSTTSTKLLIYTTSALSSISCPGTFSGHYHVKVQVNGLTYATTDGGSTCANFATTTHNGFEAWVITFKSATTTAIAANATTTITMEGSNVGEFVNWNGSQYLNSLNGGNSDGPGLGFYTRTGFSGSYTLSATMAVPGFILNYSTSTAIDTYADAYITYPENRTDIFQRDFSSWNFHYQNEYATTTYFSFRIFYGTDSLLNSSTTNYKYISSFASSTDELVFAFTSLASHELTIPLPETLATSTTYYAKVCSFINGVEDLCSATINFKTGNSTTKANTELKLGDTNLTEGGLLCNSEFYNPANWACWGVRGVVKGWNQVKDFAVALFSEGTNMLLSVFPVNVISQLSADLNSVQYATSSISSITLTGTSTAYKKPGGGYYSFTFLSSSTLAQSETRVGWNWEVIVVYLLWAMAGIVIVGSAFVLIKHAGHNSQPHA